MKKKLFCLFGCLVMTIALTGAVSNDVTAKALKDVQVESGTGCFVRDAEGNDYVDPNCNWHVVRTYDEGGNLIKYKYQDQGTLPEGAERPSRRYMNPISLYMRSTVNTLVERPLKRLHPAGNTSHPF